MNADDYIDEQLGDQSPPNAEDYINQQLAPANPVVASSSVGNADNYSLGNSILMGLRAPIDAGAQMLVHALPQSVDDSMTSLGNKLGLASSDPKTMDADIANRANQYNADRAAAGKTGFDWPYMAGNIASTVPLALAAPQLEGAPLLAKAANFLGQGYAIGATNPIISNTDNFWADKNSQGEEGAGINAVLGPLASVASKVISPTVSSAVQTLTDNGVTPTIGQIMGGATKWTEDKLSSVPVVGDMIKNAQNRASSDFNTAVANQALAPIGQSVESAPGREMVQEVSDKLGIAYNNLLPKLQFTPDSQFGSDLLAVSQKAQFLPPSQQAQFGNIIRPQLDKLANGADGQTVQGALSELKRQASGYQSDPSFDNRQLGDAISSVVGSVNGGLARTNPQYADQLSAINQGYAKYTILRKAATNLGQSTEPGVFSPSQFQSAVKSADNSVGKGNFARGTANMQDLSDAALQTLGGKYADSGTAGRGLLAAGIGALLEGGGHLAGVNPLIPAAVMGGALPYTQMGQKVASTLLTQRPPYAQPIAQAVANSTPYLTSGVNSSFAPFSLSGPPK